MVIEQPYGSPKITKDGVTVARNIEFQDRFHNLGASLVKQVATQTNDIAGDGTTTATVLARAIFNEGCKSVAAGMNPMDLRRGINMAVEKVVGELKTKAKSISTTEEIAQVATISANGEREIGELIAKAMEKVGIDGVITVSVRIGRTHARTHENLPLEDRSMLLINLPRTRARREPLSQRWVPGTHTNRVMIEIDSHMYELRGLVLRMRGSF